MQKQLSTPVMKLFFLKSFGSCGHPFSTRCTLTQNGELGGSEE